MAEGSGSKTIRVEFNDTNTDPRGGICNAEDPSNESNCYNGFGMYIVLTDTLTQHTIAFSNLQQDPTRQPSPSVFDAQHVYQVVFEILLPSCSVGPNSKCAGSAPSVMFDFWIDDLYFVNK